MLLIVKKIHLEGTDWLISFVKAGSSLFCWEMDGTWSLRCRWSLTCSLVFFGSAGWWSSRFLCSIRTAGSRPTAPVWPGFSLWSPCDLRRDTASTLNNHYLSSHELIGNDPKRKVIDSIRVIHLTDHLRRHVAWRSTCVLRVIRLHFPWNAHVSDPQISSLIQHQVFRLEISMNDPPWV